MKKKFPVFYLFIPPSAHKLLEATALPPIVLHFPECHTVGITMDTAFSDWRLSLSGVEVPSTSSHGSTPHFLLVAINIPICG